MYALKQRNSKKYVPVSGEHAIWQKPISLDLLNDFSDGSMVSHLGIEFVEIGSDYLKARMPVDARTRQPIGLLHGGASVALAETVASTAAHYSVDEAHYCVGIEINANHLRKAADGWVLAVSMPVHIGSSTQVWETTIKDDADHLISICRMTLVVRGWSRAESRSAGHK